LRLGSYRGHLGATIHPLATAHLLTSHLAIVVLARGVVTRVIRRVIPRVVRRLVPRVVPRVRVHL